MARNGNNSWQQGASVTTTYSEDAKAELLFMLEEEKLAGDLYEALYKKTGLKVFQNIAASEDKHFNALLRQADKIGLDTDDIVFNDPGEFENTELQTMYDNLLARGSRSDKAALRVGKNVERADIKDLKDAMDDVEGTKLYDVYDNLLQGSRNHWDAFDTNLDFMLGL
jgi:hypothetical protein